MSTQSFSIARFRLGHIVNTPNALSRLTNVDILLGLQRHLAGDWGDVDAHDRAANDHALVEGTRILSVYHAANGMKFWIITESDHSATTVLLPEDY